MVQNNTYVPAHTAEKLDKLANLMEYLRDRRDENPTVSLAALQSYYKTA